MQKVEDLPGIEKCGGLWHNTAQKLPGRRNVTYNSHCIPQLTPIKIKTLHFFLHGLEARTTVSQDVQTWFSVQLAFAKFLSKIMGNFWGSAVSMILALY